MSWKIFPDIAFHEYAVRPGTSSAYEVESLLSAVMLIDKATALRDKRARTWSQFLELTGTDIQPQKTIRAIPGTYNINITFVIFSGIRDKTGGEAAKGPYLKVIKGAAEREYVLGATVRVHPADAEHCLAVTGRTSVAEWNRKAHIFHFAAGKPSSGISDSPDLVEITFDTSLPRFGVLKIRAAGDQDNVPHLPDESSGRAVFFRNRHHRRLADRTFGRVYCKNRD